MQVKLAVENDPHACETYRKNLIRGPKRTRPILIPDDITEVDWTAALKDSGLKPGDCAILLGGPPCQGYSTHRINDAGVDDPRNELLLAYLDCLQVIQPRAFLVENVPGILWPRHKGYLSTFMRRARVDYQVLDPVTLNARDYGVPQNRKRVFILGFRGDTAPDIEWPPKPSHYCDSSKEVKERGLPAWRTAAEVFARELDIADLNAVHMQHGRELLEVFKNTPKNGGSRSESGRVLACHKTHDGHKDVYGRINPAVSGPTMTTACINPSKGRFVHPVEDHGITARHAARFQTFPENFIFEGGLTAAGKQIGNAVPIELGVRLIREILKALGRSTSSARSASAGARHG